MTTTNAQAECVPGIWKKEPGEGLTGHSRSGSTQSELGTKPRQKAVSPVLNLPFGAWGGWPGRGIPELASPLAD
jgi:hypothetical protein